MKRKIWPNIPSKKAIGHFKKRERNWSRNACCNCFWQRYWWRADQLLVSSRNSPRTLSESYLGPVSLSFLKAKWSVKAGCLSVSEKVNKKVKKIKIKTRQSFKEMQLHPFLTWDVIFCPKNLRSAKGITDGLRRKTNWLMQRQIVSTSMIILK